jgi:hypothetical protein
MQGLAYLELGDDALIVSIVFQVHNLGNATWKPSNVVVDLPQGYGSLQTEKDESKAGFEEVVGRGVELRGLFAPGQHDAQFRFKIPYSTDASLSFSMTLPPHVVRMRVVSEAAGAMQLDVTGFPEPVRDYDRSGRPVLTADRELARGEPPLEKLTITLSYLPQVTRSGSWFVVIAVAMMLTGVLFAHRMRRDRIAERDLGQAKSRLVDEIVALDDAHARSSIAASGYDRMRRALLDALGHILTRSNS